MNKITVIGLGYIGLPMSLLLASKKLRINAYDVDKNKIDDLNKGICTLGENKIVKLFEKKSLFLNFTNKLSSSDIYIICVPTPVKKINNYYYKSDLKILNNVFNKLKKIIKKNDLVIIESTCPPLTAINMYNKICKEKNVDIAVCPERAIPGNTIEEMTNNDRIIGCSNKIVFKKISKLYNSFNKGKKHFCSLIEAELTKLFENTYRDVNIALSNELDSICSNFGANSKTVISKSNLHPRVNILEPGIGVGGHCIPVDPWFLINKKNKKDSIIFCSRKINLDREKKITKKILSFINKKKCENILCYGATYKPDTEDTRNSPALNIYFNLRRKTRANVEIYDPFLDQSNYTSLIKKKFDLIIVLVKHKNYNKLIFKTKHKMIF
jgi:nucleotide sugar dehydrogenase